MRKHVGPLRHSGSTPIRPGHPEYSSAVPLTQLGEHRCPSPSLQPLPSTPCLRPPPSHGVFALGGNQGATLKLQFVSTGLVGVTAIIMRVWLTRSVSNRFRQNPPQTLPIGVLASFFLSEGSWQAAPYWSALPVPLDHGPYLAGGWLDAEGERPPAPVPLQQATGRLSAGDRRSCLLLLATNEAIALAWAHGEEEATCCRSSQPFRSTGPEAVNGELT